MLAGQELGDAESITAGRALLLSIPLDAAIRDLTDIIGGIAGTLAALALAADALGRDDALLARAREFAERLLARGTRDATARCPGTRSATRAPISPVSRTAPRASHTRCCCWTRLSPTRVA